MLNIVWSLITCALREFKQTYFLFLFPCRYLLGWVSINLQKKRKKIIHGNGRENLIEQLGFAIF